MADDAGQAELQERADRVEAFGYVPSDGASLGFDPEVEPPSVEEIAAQQKEVNKEHLMPPDGLAAEPIVTSDAGTAEEGAGADGRPADSASRAEWDAYAESQGEDPSQFSSKQELIDFFS